MQGHKPSTINVLTQAFIAERTTVVPARITSTYSEVARLRAEFLDVGFTLAI